METFLKALEKTPEMMALIGLVWLFLKAQSESRSEFLAAIREIHLENMQAREMTREVVRENTTSNNNLTLAVHSLEKRIMLMKPATT